MVNNEPFSSDIDFHHCAMMESAAAGGSIEVMQWLRNEHNVQYSASALESATKYDQLDVIQHLRSDGCPWDARACTAVAGCDYRYTAAGTAASCCATLQWLRDHGCPWDVAKVRLAAAKSGNIDILAYAKQHSDMPAAAELTKMLNIAGAYNKVEAAQWLRQQGACWPIVLEYKEQGSYTSFTQVWHGATLKWARNEGCM
jgi:hypothetical protein